MKHLSIAIGLLGALHLTFWVWAPWIAQWQIQNTLARFGSLDGIDVIMQVLIESMRFTFIEAAISGAMMLIASWLLIRSRFVGWWLWLTTLILSATATLAAIFGIGPSGGILLRLLLLAIFAYASLRAYRRGAISNLSTKSA